eukprot:GAHX01002267.1.p1 GENE.GAHX01002267.1~~GAHX01002267.1.p1  ORF type:complete len:276 (+),score=37.05 GAHX01002267.1:383-1210(+)
MLMRDLLDYPDLQVFKLEEILKESDSNNVERDLDTKRNNGPHNQTPLIDITKQMIQNIYSKTMILYINLSDTLKEHIESVVKKHYNEQYLLYYINKQIIQYVGTHTIMNTRLITKWHEYEATNNTLFNHLASDKIGSAEISHFQVLYRNVTSFVHEEISQGNLTLIKRDEGNNDLVIPNTDDTHIDIEKFIIIIDEADILLSHPASSTKNEFEELTESTILDTILCPVRSSTTANIPRSIRYLISSILPIMTHNEKENVHPEIIPFNAFNINNPE